MRITGVLFIVALICSVTLALDNGLGRTPQMGWNSWNHFGCNINEQLIRATAKALASSSLKAAGYIYVNMDDCWAYSRDAKGNISPDPKAFPSGIANLTQYVHSLGLKFGLYSDAGNLTCAGRPGSLNHETNDANSYAEWGVDYLKYDNCYNEGIIPEKRYPIMRDALNKTGRPIFFSMCEWGVDNPATWAAQVGNSWRTTDDINDSWYSMISNMEYNSMIGYAAGPGGWNDPDMLEVGNGGMTNVEYVSHFSLWAMMKAPLLIGNDITSMSKQTLDILANTEVIAVNQDPLGIQATRIQIPRSLDNLTITNVSVVPCTNSANQKWYVNSTDNTIRNQLTGGCLTIPECSKGEVIPQVVPCNTTKICAGQNKWVVNSTGNWIKNEGTNLCIMPWSTKGPQVVQVPCQTNTFWYSHSSLQIVNTNAWDAYYGGCLNVDLFTGLEIWYAPLTNGTTALLLFNQTPEQANITAAFDKIELEPSAEFYVRDLWAHEELGKFKGSFSAAVAAHGVVLVKLTPVN